jgi:hypothetical protein
MTFAFMLNRHSGRRRAGLYRRSKDLATRQSYRIAALHSRRRQPNHDHIAHELRQWKDQLVATLFAAHGLAA